MAKSSPQLPIVCHLTLGNPLSYLHAAASGRAECGVLNNKGRRNVPAPESFVCVVHTFVARVWGGAAMYNFEEFLSARLVVCSE